MTEQERPRTEAGRSLLDVLPDLAGVDDPEWLDNYRRTILAIEEAARTEGRQQAVREIRERLNLLIMGMGWERVASQQVKRILDEVAGLNASESPPDPCGCGAGCVLPHDHRDASWDDTLTDASESGQPPEVSDES